MSNNLVLAIKRYFFISLMIILVFNENSYSQENIENSKEYIEKSARIKYIKAENHEIREVIINGLKVNDEYIASISNDKKLYNKVISEIYNRRIRNILFSIIGLPLSSAMGYYANKENTFIYTDNRVFQNTTGLGFFLNTLSVFISLYSIINLIDFFNDISGINKINILTNEEVENIIKSYNLKLKDEIYKRNR